MKRKSWRTKELLEIKKVGKWIFSYWKTRRVQNQIGGRLYYVHTYILTEFLIVNILPVWWDRGKVGNNVKKYYKKVKSLKNKVDDKGEKRINPEGPTSSRSCRNNRKKIVVILLNNSRKYCWTSRWEVLTQCLLQWVAPRHITKIFESPQG